MILSLIIPCRDKNDPKLKDLLRSIDEQDFPKDQMETLVITEGTSESAKAIGIRKAKVEVIGILASDNELRGSTFLEDMYSLALSGSAYPSYYHYERKDNTLNRYFSLIGCNDPLSWYMEKTDRLAYGINTKLSDDWRDRTIGDNGFFVRKDFIESTDLDNYFHIDNATETLVRPYMAQSSIWHKTGGNMFLFFRKRVRYGLQHAFNKNRRWHLVDFKEPKDIRRLVWFILATLTVIQPLSLSVRGWLKIRDKAWFLHWPVCAITLGVYTTLMIVVGLRKITRSLFAPTAARIL